MPFFIIFIVVPFIELALFAAVSEHIGIGTTLLLAFLTAIIGGGLVRYQGLHTLFVMHHSIDRGELPLNSIFDGFCIVAAGALLITPGFLTDFIGFALLVPPVRSVLRTVIRDHTRWSVNAQIYESRRGMTPDPTVIEGECEEIRGDDK